MAVAWARRPPSEPGRSRTVPPELAESSYAMWFTGVRATSLHDGVLEVATPSDYVRDWLAKHCHVPMIEQVASDAADAPVRVHLVVAPAETARREPSAPTWRRRPSATPSPPHRSGLQDSRSQYTFETFVAGPSEPFAHAAAMAVARPAPKAYNPAVLYGGVGLGKTHPLVAIGHHMTRLALGSA